MNKIIFTQQLYLLKQEANDYLSTNNLQNLLVNNNIIILSGLKNIGRLSLVKKYIIEEKLEKNFFYFNSKIDYNNSICNYKNLENLLNEYIEYDNKPKIIILENFSKIKGIKNFIRKIIEDNYKIILIGNNIKITGIPNIEYLNINNNIELFQAMKYGSINEIIKIEDKQTKEKYLSFLINDIYINDIIGSFGVKNIFLYNYIMTFLSNNNNFYSLRELQREILKKENIALKTLIDYIDFSLKSKLIKQVYQYDLKKDKVITTRKKFYFIDNGIRNSYTNFNLDTKTLIENHIFLNLLNKGYEIYSGKNGKFEFDFIAISSSLNQEINKDKDKSINSNSNELKQENRLKKYFHISKYKNKDDIKKEIKKLNKIDNNNQKYLIIPEIERYNFKKYEYDNVKLISIKNTD